jgi:NAD(P)-dependent dehydrogenase (short-subunit alcohol dehydrogenase family)
MVTGAASELGLATVRVLVERGAEVHAVDATKPDIAGIASFTECDLRSPQQIDEAVQKIGRFLNAVFICVDAGTTEHLLEAVQPLLLEGAEIVTLP